MTYEELRESVADINRTVRELNDRISNLRDEFGFEPFDDVSILVDRDKRRTLPLVVLSMDEIP